mgnify:FL=1
MNKCCIVGRVTRDLELRHTQSGIANVSFSLAVDKGLSRQKREEFEAQSRPTADFPRVVVWGQMAENLARYCGKGSQIAVVGRIETGSYEDKDGKTIYTTDIVAENVEFLSKSTQDESKSNSGVNTNRGNQNQSDGFFEDDFSEIEDDGRLPF